MFKSFVYHNRISEENINNHVLGTRGSPLPVSVHSSTSPGLLGWVCKGSTLWLITALFSGVFIQ